MKKIRIGYLIALLGLILAGCSEDTDRTIYHANQNDVAFPIESDTYTFGADDPDKYDIVIWRANKVGELKLDFTVTESSGLFSIPSSLTFKDGEGSANLEVTFDREDLEVGKPYQINISLPKTSLAHRESDFSVTITRDFIWNFFAEGTFYTGLFGVAVPVDIMKAEGTEGYKIESIFEDGYDFVFLVDEDGNMSSTGDPNDNGYYVWTTGFVDDEYGMISIHFDPNEASYFDAENKKAVFKNQYRVAAGNFGWFLDELNW